MQQYLLRTDMKPACLLRQGSDEKCGSEPCLPPLSNVNSLNDPGDLIDESDGPSDVVENLHISDLLPWHGHVFHQLQYCMRHILKGPGTTEEHHDAVN